MKRISEVKEIDGVSDNLLVWLKRQYRTTARSQSREACAKLLVYILAYGSCGDAKAVGQLAQRINATAMGERSEFLRYCKNLNRTGDAFAKKAIESICIQSDYRACVPEMCILISNSHILSEQIADLYKFIV